MPSHLPARSTCRQKMTSKEREWWNIHLNITKTHTSLLYQLDFLKNLLEFITHAIPLVKWQGWYRRVVDLSITFLKYWMLLNICAFALSAFQPGVINDNHRLRMLWLSMNARSSGYENKETMVWLEVFRRLVQKSSPNILDHRLLSSSCYSLKTRKLSCMKPFAM